MGSYYGRMESCLSGRPLVKSSVEAAKRKLARPVQPKEPLFADKSPIGFQDPGLGLFKGQGPGI